MFVKQIEVSGLAVFAYIVACKKTKEALVIDPAADGEKDCQGSQRAEGYNIKYIVNTHSHIDHTMGNRRMKELTDAEIIIHEKEANSSDPSIIPHDKHVWCRTFTTGRHHRKRRRHHYNR